MAPLLHPPNNRAKAILRLLDHGYECRHGIWFSPTGLPVTFSDALLELDKVAAEVVQAQESL